MFSVIHFLLVYVSVFFLVKSVGWLVEAWDTSGTCYGYLWEFWVAINVMECTSSEDMQCTCILYTAWAVIREEGIVLCKPIKYPVWDFDSTRGATCTNPSEQKFENGLVCIHTETIEITKVALVRTQFT